MEPVTRVQIIVKEVRGRYTTLATKKNTWNQFLIMVSQISRLDIIFHTQSCLPMCFSCSTNLLLNILFSLPQQSSPAVLYLSSSRVVHHRDSNDTALGAFMQDLSNHAKMPYLGHSHNVIIYKCAYVKHNSWSGGCEFDFSNRPFLSPWSHFIRQTYSSTLWAAACVISFAAHRQSFLHLALCCWGIKHSGLPVVMWHFKKRVLSLFGISWKGPVFRLRFNNQYVHANLSLVKHFPTPEKYKFLTATISLLVLSTAYVPFFTLWDIMSVLFNYMYYACHIS